MDRKCSAKKPAKPIVSDGNFFRVTFKSNDRFDGTGFEAYYHFNDNGEFKFFHENFGKFLVVLLITYFLRRFSNLQESSACFCFRNHVFLNTFYILSRNRASIVKLVAI